MLKEIEAGQLWCVETPMTMLSLHFGARLTVVHLRNGTLWLCAPLAICDEDEAAIRAPGEITHVVAPNNFHRTQIGEFARRFPNAQLWLVPALATKMDELPHLPLRALPPDWNEDFDGVLFDAALNYQEWIFCHRATKTLIVTDLVMNLPRPDTPLARIVGAMLDEGRACQPSRLEKAMIYAGRDLKQARAQVNELLGWNFERIVMAHGAIIERDGKRVMRRAMRWL